MSITDIYISVFYYFIIQDQQDFYNFQNVSDSDITKRINFDNNLTDQYKFINSCVINNHLFKKDLTYKQFSLTYWEQAVIRAENVNNVLTIIDISPIELIDEVISNTDEPFAMYDGVSLVVRRMFENTSDVNNYLFNNLTTNVSKFLTLKYSYYDNYIMQLKQLIILLISKHGAGFYLDYDQLVYKYIPTLIELNDINDTGFVSSREHELAKLALGYCKERALPRLLIQVNINKSVLDGIRSRHALDNLSYNNDKLTDDDLNFDISVGNETIDKLFNLK